MNSSQIKTFNLRARLSVGVVLTTVVMLAVVCTVGFVGYYALDVVYQNKLRDTWAIMFLDLEQRSNKIATRLESAQQTALSKAPDILMREEGPNAYRIFRGASQGLVKAKEIPKPETANAGSAQLQIIGFREKQYVLRRSSHVQEFSIEGQSYPPGNYLYLSLVDTVQLIQETDFKKNATTFYIANRTGQLIFSNDINVKEADLIKRPLVSAFMTQPLTQGQLDIPREDGARIYGFYQEVPGTNLVVFAERDRRDALAIVQVVAMSFLSVIAIAVVVLVLVLQFPLQSITRPLRDLLRMSRDIAGGNFLSRPRYQGYGELSALTNAFVSMAESLQYRDDRIASLVEDQKSKIRIDHELEIAKAIQNNLLTIGAIPRSSGLDLAITYRPASEVAGDWYGCHYDESLGETVVVIADVTGHGVGAAMVTAMMSVIFDESVASGKSFDAESFVQRLNRSLYKLGKGRASATMIIFKYRRKDQVIELINVSHPRPLFTEGRGQLKSVGGKGVATLLGIDPEVVVPKEEISFPRGCQILLYSDGLITGSNGKNFGRKQVGKILTSSRSGAKDSCSKIESAWNQSIQGNADDDLCLIVVRAA